jgi:ArsR family transcriptional regulator
MDMNTIFKALSNPLRIQILTWLRTPDEHFSEMIHLPDHEKGKGYVCVSAIQEKAEVTQSTTSHYLNLMRQAGLLSCKRIGQWTYYRRNDDTLNKLAEFIATKL